MLYTTLFTIESYLLYLFIFACLGLVVWFVTFLFSPLAPSSYIIHLTVVLILMSLPRQLI